MAQSQFVSKRELFDYLKRLIVQRETGLLSILTDTKRSILFKFSNGKIVHSYCRTKDIRDAVQVLNECALVKYNYVRASMEDQPELMPSDVFLQLLEPGAQVVATPASVGSGNYPDTHSLPASPSMDNGDAGVKRVLIDIALDYVGPVADLIVDEALENVNNPVDAIEYIAELIPDPHRAAEFRVAAREQLPDTAF